MDLSKWPWTIVAMALSLAFISGTLITVDSVQSSILQADPSAHVDGFGGLAGYRAYYFALSLPILVLGIYVTAVGASISADLRDEDLQYALKGGMRRGSILAELMIESLAVGFVTGLLGYVLGIVVSRTMLTSLATSITWYEEVSITSTDLSLTVSSFLATIGLGMVVVVVTSILAASKATKPARTDPSELAPLGVLPIVEIALIGLSLVSVFGILGGTQYVGSHGLERYVGSLGVVLNSLVILLFPAMPFMLAVGLAGLLSRWPISVQRRLMKILSRRSAGVSIPLGPMAARCDKRARRMSILVALVLVFVVFVSVSMQTIVTAQKEDARLGIGADIIVYVSYIGGWWQGTGWWPDCYFPSQSNFSWIDGISHMTLCQHFVASMPDDPWGYATAIDPQSYLETAYLRSSDANGDPEEVLSLLESPTNALVTESYASEHGLERGDSLQMQMTSYVIGSNDTVTFTVSASVAHIVSRLPALSEVVVGYAALSSIPKYTFDHYAQAVDALVDAEPGAEMETIGDQVMDTLESCGYYGSNYRLLDSELEDIDASPDVGGLFSFLTSEVAVTVTVVLVGVAMTSYATSRIATRTAASSVMARQDPRTLKAVLASESASLAILGASVGVFVGLLTSYLFGMMWKPYDFPRPTIGADFTALVLVVAAALSLGLVVLAALSSLAGSSRGPSDSPNEPNDR